MGEKGEIGFNFEIIKDYLLSEGGKVEYHKLIKHFKNALANPENKEARVLFKDLVNQVAIVTTEGNNKYLSLRQPLSDTEPPKLPPRSIHNDQTSYADSRTNPKYQSTVNYQFDEFQNKSPHQLSLTDQQIHNTKLLANSQHSFGNQHANINQLLPSADVTLNQTINNQFNQQVKSFQINDTQPRQPFSYDLSQPMPTYFNQRVHSVKTDHIQQKSLTTISQMPILPNMVNANLMINSNQNNKFISKTDFQTSSAFKNQWSNPNVDCPPKAPPRRKSFANGSNTYLNRKDTNDRAKDNENFLLSTPKQFTDKIKEINELKFNSPGRVKEHAKKLNKMVSESELKLPIPLGINNATNTNNQNNLKDDSDLPDHIKRRWMVKSSCCDYNELQQMLKDFPKLAKFKDITSGYNALHWAAKFNKPDIIKLIAGTHNVNPNIKTSGYTPCHLAAMFEHKEIIDLLVKGYGADNTIRDYSGRSVDELVRINNKKLLTKFADNGLSRKNQEIETKSNSLLARTASLRQTHKQFFDRLPSKYRTMK